MIGQGDTSGGWVMDDWARRDRWVEEDRWVEGEMGAWQEETRGWDGGQVTRSWLKKKSDGMVCE